MSNELTSYTPRDIGELSNFAERLSKAQIVPQQYRGKPNDVFAACMWGWETAQLTPMIALNYIDVIQGRAAYKSEGLVAVALRKGYISDIEEVFEGEGDEYAAVCTVTKANGKTLTRRFSLSDAKAAGLAGKDNWRKWLDRMLIARARGFAVRDAAPHAMLSYTAEEVRDFDQPARGPEQALDITPKREQHENGMDAERKAALIRRAKAPATETAQAAPPQTEQPAESAAEPTEPEATRAAGQFADDVAESTKLAWTKELVEERGKEMAAALRDHGGSTQTLDETWSLFADEIATMPGPAQRGLRKVYTLERNSMPDSDLNKHIEQKGRVEDERAGELGV